MSSKFLTRSIFLGLSLLSTVMLNGFEAIDVKELDSPDYSEFFDKSHASTFAVLSNQVAVVSGQNIPWSPVSNTISSNISVDALGNISLPYKGYFLVKYTVRINRSPFDGIATARVQLQQTSGGIAQNIDQAAITSVTFEDGVSNDVPASQTQIIGYAIIKVSSSSNNIINLAVNITEDSNLTIPEASGIDANAQLVIVQLK